MRTWKDNHFEIRIHAAHKRWGQGTRGAFFQILREITKRMKFGRGTYTVMIMKISHDEPEEKKTIDRGDRVK